MLKILALFVCLQTAFAAEEWQNYSVPFPIWDAVATKDGVWFATNGGVRYKDGSNDMVYTPAKGLEASTFYGVVYAPKGVFAISEYGLIARLADDFSRWKVLNRSFPAGNVRVVPGQVKYAEEIMVIAFETKIAFVDINTVTSILSIDRIGEVSLSIYGPEKIEIRDDSLFVQTPHGTFVRIMDWKNLKKDKRLVDPESWTRVDSHALDKKDSLKVVVHGKTLNDSVLYDEGKSRVLWQFDVKDQTYLIGHNLIAVYSEGKLEDISEYAIFQLDGVYELQAIPEGGVIAASQDGLLATNMGGFWHENIEAFLGLGNRNEAYSYRLKTLSILPNGKMIYHIWGTGFQIYWTLEHLYNVSPYNDNCMDKILGAEITVAVGTTVAPDMSGFLTATSATEKYSVDFISPEGELSCATGVGSTSYAGPLVSRMDPENSDWIVYVSTRDNFSAFAEGGMDIFRFPAPSKNGGRLMSPELKTVDGLGGATPIDMVIDEPREVLWLVTATGIGYMEFDKDTIRKPMSMNGLLGAEYTSIDVDPLGNVWVGTTTQGVYRLERRNGSFDTLTATHYTMTDGLLNNMVLDLSIDKKYGDIWMAHENGVSILKRNDLRRTEGLMTDSAEVGIMVYPVPFRPHMHKYVVIDNISDAARVDIYNRGGALMRSFAGSEVAGGRVEWDALGPDNRLVAPGVYYYVVRTSSKVKKGKFIVVH